MLGYATGEIKIPKGALLGIDLPVPGSETQAVRVAILVQPDLVEPVYYHQRKDNAAFGR